MPDRNHGLDLHERRAWAGKAVSLWPQPVGTAQALWWQAIDEAGASRPVMPRVAPHLDFERNADGLTALLANAGLGDVRCRMVGWTFRVGHFSFSRAGALQQTTWWTGCEDRCRIRDVAAP